MEHHHFVLIVCFYRFGPSASIEEKDALCILTYNIVNEKTYIFIWFWFIILASLIALVVIFRLLIILSPALRVRLMQAGNRRVPFRVVKYVSRNVGIGDWWFLYMLRKNIDQQIYHDVIEDLAKKIVKG